MPPARPNPSSSPGFQAGSEFYESVGKVTVGVPVRNGGDFLWAALESLRNQTYEHFEVIIQDNASEDATSEIAREFAALDHRFSYVRLTQDVGSVANFNRLLDNATGEFFMWAAHDDLRDPEYLTETVRELRKVPSALGCATAGKIIDENGKPLGQITPPSRLKSSKPGKRVREALLTNYGGFGVYCLFRRSRLRPSLRLAPDVWAPDVAFSFALGLAGHFCVIDRPLFVYRKLDDATKVARSERDAALHGKANVTKLLKLLVRQTNDAELSPTLSIAVWLELANFIRHWRKALRGESLFRLQQAWRSRDYWSFWMDGLTFAGLTVFDLAMLPVKSFMVPRATRHH